MNDNSRKASEAAIKTMLGGWVVLLAALQMYAALAGAGGRLWGAGYWDFLGVNAACAMAVVIVLVVLPPVAARLASLASGIGSVAGPPASGPAREARAVIVLAAAALVFWLCRSAVHLLGDGYLLIRALEEGNRFKLHAPLAYQLTLLTGKALGGGGAERWEFAFRLTSIGSGLSFLVLLWLTARRAGGSSAAGRALVFGGVATLGLVQLFFGYVEVYPPLAAALMLYLWLALRALEEGDAASLRGASLALWLCVAMHLTALALLPSLVYQHYRALEGRRAGRAALEAAFGWVVAPVLVAGLALMAGVEFHPAAVIDESGPLPFLLFGNEAPGERAFGLFGAVHLGQLVNLVLLNAPLLVPLAVAAVVLRRRAFDPAGRFLVAASVFPLGALALFVPSIGFPRDWDIFAWTFVAPVLLGLRALARTEGGSGLLRYAAVVTVVSGALFAGSWVAVNAGEKIALARYEALMDSSAGYTVNALVSGHEEAAVFYRRRGEADLALDHYYEAVEANPGYSRLWVNIAVLELERGRPERGLNAAERVMELEPENVRAHYVRGVALSRMGRMARAIGAYDRLLELDPDNRRGLLNRGSLYVLTGENDLAEEDFSRLIEAAPEDPEGWLSRGVLRARAGDREAALSDLRRAAELGSGAAKGYVAQLEALMDAED